MDIEAISELVVSLPEKNFEVIKGRHPWIPDDKLDAKNAIQQNPQLAFTILEELEYMKVIDSETALLLQQKTPTFPPDNRADGSESTPPVRDMLTLIGTVGSLDHYLLSSRNNTQENVGHQLNFILAQQQRTYGISRKLHINNRRLDSPTRKKRKVADSST